MKKLFTLKLSLLFFFPVLVAFKGQAQAIIGQQTDYSAGYTWFSNYYDPEMDYTDYQGSGETFKSLVTGTLGTIQIYLINVNNPGTMDVVIYSCSSTTTWGSVLGTKTGVSLTAAGWKTVDVTALNIPVTAGNYYGFRLMPQGGIQTGIGESNHAYPNGQGWVIWADGSMHTSGWNIAFAATAASTLPVTLNSFTAQKQANTVLLQWSTATEQNSKDFTVQHSADGNNWINITTLPAAGNSNAMRPYSYVHPNPAAGNNYYRLLQTDIDGKSIYSELRVVKFAADEPGFTVLANPVSNGMLRVRVNAATSLWLYGADGRLLWKKQLGAGVQSMDMSGFGKGVFTLKGTETTVQVLVP